MLAASGTAAESRKVAAILVADIVGFGRLVERDEEGTLARLRGLRRELIDPAIAIHNGRLIKRLGDGGITEFRSVVEAVRCAKEVLHGLVERNAGLPDDQRIEVRIGIHLGDVVEEADGDLMGDGVNIAARLESVCEPGGICLSEDAYRQVRDKINDAFVDLGEQNLKNIHPIRVYALADRTAGVPASRSLSVLPSPPASFGFSPTLGQRSLRASGLLFLLLVGTFLLAAETFAILGTLAWRGQAPVAPPSPAPPPAGAVEALERFQKLLSYSTPPMSDKLAEAPHLSFVVLPFANLSGDPEQDRLAQGLTDDLTADLSRLPDSFVVERTTASAYSGKSVDEKRLGRGLGARYALEGAVHRVGHMIAISAQLVSTEDGVVVWSDRFVSERDRPDEMQSEFASRIAGQVWRALERK